MPNDESAHAIVELLLEICTGSWIPKVRNPVRNSFANVYCAKAFNR
jgi:hypothetical protein